MAIAAVEELTPKGVLAELRECDLVERVTGARRLLLATVWADQHPAIRELPYAAPIVESLLDDGARGLAAAAVAEFAAVLGVSTESGAGLLADSLELRNRLPRTWALVQEHRMIAWKARRLAQATRPLSAEGAGWVDVQAALLGDRLGDSKTRQLVLMARVGFDDDGVPDPNQHRWVTINADQNCLDGAAHLDGRLDVPDALDLEAAVAAVAAELAVWGCDGDLGARRAAALGVLARTRLGQTTLPTPDPDIPHAANDADMADTADDAEKADVAGVADRKAGAAGSHPANPGLVPGQAAGRAVLLYVHLSVEAITGGATCLAEVGTTGQLVTADQIRDWCATAGTITIRPVIDLNTDHGVRGYQPTDRIREHIALRDQTCVFPWCTRPARPVPRQSGEYSFDADHITPWKDGGQTSTDQLACLCRRHHRLKTHTGWRYVRIAAAQYLWTSPNGYQFLRTTNGTIGIPPPTSRE